MYLTKQKIYLYFDKTQKSMLCTFLRSYVKQNLEESEEDLLDKFIYDQKYYLKIKSSRFPYLEEYVDNPEFLGDTISYIKACKKYYEYKKSQAPIIEKQKEFEKEKRKFLQKVKMSKEKPTKKQIHYYNILSKRYNIEKIDVENASKLDLRDEIERILNEHSRYCEDTNR